MDRWLSLAVAAAAVGEVALRHDLTHRPAALIFGLACAVAVWFRRRYPLFATLFGFGLATTLTLLGWQDDNGPYMGASLLLLPYTLFRWAPPRHLGIGFVSMAAAYLSSAPTKLSDVIGGAVVLMFPAAIGLVMRYRAEAQQQEIAHAKSKEREQLARELHDSVAHHMMAITIQAQAARASPNAADAALKAIEEESRRTLAELRAIVGSLRDEAAFVPGTIADIAQLGAAMPVHVELSGNLQGLPPQLERAVYRLAQESITNATKHAKNATRVHVRVEASDEEVRLTVDDDGEARPRNEGGFGLTGMAERAALLGGTFHAGFGTKGWRVDARLPRRT